MQPFNLDHGKDVFPKPENPAFDKEKHLGCISKTMGLFVMLPNLPNFGSSTNGFTVLFILRHKFSIFPETNSSHLKIVRNPKG